MDGPEEPEDDDFCETCDREAWPEGSFTCPECDAELLEWFENDEAEDCASSA